MAEMIRGLKLLEISGGLNLVLLGKIGAGKSASGNTILGRQAFESKESFTSITQDLTVESGTVFGRRVTVYDTPGLFNTKLSEEKVLQIYEKVLQRCESGRCAFLLVIKADRFTEKERRTVEKIEELLGEKRLKKTWILFTGRDELEEENKSIDEFINETEPLKRLVQKYDQRYHVFNNKKKEPNGQVQELLTKIDAIEKGAKAKRTIVMRPQQLVRACVRSSAVFEPRRRRSIYASEWFIRSNKPVASRRIVLLGQTGVGKSAAGNTILGQKEFNSVMKMNSVTSKSSDAHSTVSDRSVTVVDTPGFFHTELNTDELLTEIARSVYISSPGPHAFLIVFNLSMRFTEQELQILEQIKTQFGEGVLKYSIFLFTHGDQLEEQTVEKLIEENCVLRHLVDQCGGRYHVFSNKHQNNREQVNDLLQKIDTMIEQNGGGHYSNQMFQEPPRFEQRQEEIERVRKETEEKIRAEFEGPPRFLLERLKSMRLREENWKQQEEERQKELERMFQFLPSSLRQIMMLEEKHEAKQKKEEQRQEEIERVIKETEKRVREFIGSQRFFLERFKSMRQREEEERKQMEKQRQEEVERVRKETEERIRAEIEGPPSYLLKRFRSMRLREEEEKTQREEKQRQEEVERVRKETEERVRAEFEGPPSFLLERLKSMRQREENWARYMVEEEKLKGFFPWRYMRMTFFSPIRRDDIERVIKGTEEKIRAEFDEFD